MPYTVHLERERQLIRSTWVGTVSAIEITRYIEEVWTDPAVREFAELIDFRAVESVQVANEEIHEFAVYSRKYDNPATMARSAVIAPEGLIYGLSRMFSTLRTLDPEDRREFKVFAELEPAMNWLDDD